MDSDNQMVYIVAIVSLVAIAAMVLISSKAPQPVATFSSIPLDEQTSAIPGLKFRKK